MYTLCTLFLVPVYIMDFQWNEEKNEKLLQERDICFEDIVQAIKEGGLIFDKPHPNTERYPHQYILLVSINKYPYMIPYVKHGNTYFLKTIYPSRANK
jgi:hypothetical protein